MSLNCTQERRLPVLTSNGDALGMDAAVRAIVRVELGRGLEIFGIRRGSRPAHKRQTLLHTNGGRVTRKKSLDEFLLRTLHYAPVS